MAESGNDPVEILYSVVQLLKPAAEVLPVVGRVLGGVVGVAKALLPDPKIKAVIKQVEELQKSVDSIKDDIAILNNHVNWNSRMLPLQGHINNIKAAIRILLQSVEYTKASDMVRAESSRKDLRDMKDRLCEAVDGLLSEVTGAELRDSVLKLFYQRFEGNRTKMAAIGGVLFQFVLGGIMALLAIKAMEFGIYGPDMLVKRYLGRIVIAEAQVLQYIKRCEDEVKDNLKRDIETFMSHPFKAKAENKEIALALKMHLREKYDWLFLYYIVFAGTKNPDRDHLFDGQYIGVHRGKGHKCASVFFLSKMEYSLRSVCNKDMVLQIIHGSREAKNAGKGDFVRKDLERRQIKYWGIGCIRQDLKPWWEGEDGDKIIWQKAGAYMMCVLLQ